MTWSVQIVRHFVIPPGSQCGYVIHVPSTERGNQKYFWSALKIVQNIGSSVNL